MAINRTTTVQAIFDWCRLHTSLQSFFLLGQNQPGMTIANSMQQALLGSPVAQQAGLGPTPRPMSWKFNRKVLDSTNGGFLVTQYGVQDYRHAGAVAFVLQANAGSSGSPFGGVGVDMVFSAANATFPNGKVAGITVAGGTVTVQTLDPHPFSAGQIVNFAGLIDSGGVFNSTFTTNSLTRTSTWSGGFTILTVPDQFHFTFAAPAGTSATITNIAIAANVLTVTAANSYKVGQVILFSGVGTNTFLNGQQVTILTASGSQFTAQFVHADVASGADTGSANVCSGAPGFGTSDPNGNAIGLPAWGWGESASLVDINSTAFPQPVTPDVEIVRELAPASNNISGDKLRICMFLDEGNGVLRFRYSEPFSGYNFQANLVYQARAPKLTTPQSVFAWPDDMAYVLHEVGLAYAFRFAKGISATETVAQMQVAREMIAAALSSEEREANDQGLVPGLPLMR